ncbi:transketolase [Clostridium sp. AM58-1XD]|uniref:transketolase n=1 Tax=Clostridium sp. AM58-1XD TaxID=2292307 RepID=UPI000E4D0FDF|nr:transketolase [Clostridium sp. AM58-1XD]RGY99937.1 transketolase [Clostridium sp. AM58-1XD]
MSYKEDMTELKKFSKRIQIETVKMIGGLGVGHLGGSLSIADLLSVLYGKQMKYRAEEPDWTGRDWLVCSKGHAGPAVYSALALKGFMPMEELKTLNRPGTNLPSHCDRNRTPGIDMTTGSLGQGASAAAGIALGFKMKGMDNWVYLILGDGEIDEGQVWEMALFAGHRKLSNLIAFVDHNKLQLDGPTADICDLGDIAAKFREFGWFAQTADGHSQEEIDQAVEKAKEQNEKPSMIVLNTVKGHGWSRMENQLGSHCPSLDSKQTEEAVEEMEAALRQLELEEVEG